MSTSKCRCGRGIKAARDGHGPYTKCFKCRQRESFSTTARASLADVITAVREPEPITAPTEEAATTPAEEGETRDALDVIDRFELDYNLGNAVRFVLEADEGVRLENLQAARSYLDRAIARCGG